MTSLPELRLLPLAAAMLAIASPAMAQMDHSKMPGMKMPAPAAKPAPKPAAKKPAAKKPAASNAAARKPAAAPRVKRPVARPRPATTAPAAHDMTTMSEQPGASQTPPACLPEHAAMGHCSLPTPQPAAQAACLPEHAAMGHCTLATPPAEMQTQPPCLPEHAAAGHCTPTVAAEPQGTDLPAGDAAAPPAPVANAADAFYGPDAMAMGRHHLSEFHGCQKLYQVMANILEAQIRNGGDGYEWDAEAWYGGDIDRLWLKSEGDGEFGGPVEKAEVQALYSHAIGPYFNLQGGVRYDFKPNPSRVYAVAAVEGLAPSFFDVEGSLFLSNKGELMARVDGYYDQRITQRLILQPRVELNFAAQNSPSIGVGAGLSDAEAGLRLRYDIRREFAPYVGIQYRRAFGRTRDYLRADGEDTGGLSLLLGIRAWF